VPEGVKHVISVNEIPAHVPFPHGVALAMPTMPKTKTAMLKLIKNFFILNLLSLIIIYFSPPLRRGFNQDLSKTKKSDFWQPGCLFRDPSAFRPCLTTGLALSKH
jgi:hypothetical protein